MARDGGSGGSGSGGPASIVAAAAAVGTAEGRFPSRTERLQNGWRSRGCWSGLSCFGSDKRTKRVVPSSRIPDGNAASVSGNGSRPVGRSNQNTTVLPPLIAPPSSPASLTNSSLPSTSPSPNCFRSTSDNSLGEHSSTMFVTGPYAHETQLVSPPVFSAFTTEPSTASLTPPPELAHLTTPSSPDVPYAHYLSSSTDFRGVDKISMVAGNDLQTTYPLCPGSPSSSFISPASGTPRTGACSPFPESETPSQWDGSVSCQDAPCNRNGTLRPFNSGTSDSKKFMLSLDSSFFYLPSAQFHLDQARQSHGSKGRLSISKEVNKHTNGGHRHNKTFKEDVEELESYRASFGFSADELVTSRSHVEVSDEVDISFSVPPFPSSNSQSSDHHPINDMIEKEGERTIPSGLSEMNKSNPIVFENADEVDARVPDNSESSPGHPHPSILGDGSRSDGEHHASADDILFLKMRDVRGSKSFHAGLSVSDAAVDYRRSRSLKETILTL